MQALGGVRAGHRLCIKTAPVAYYAAYGRAQAKQSPGLSNAKQALKPGTGPMQALMQAQAMQALMAGTGPYASPYGRRKGCYGGAARQDPGAVEY